MFGVSEPLYRALRRNHLGPRDVRVGDVRFNADIVAKVPKGAAANFPPKNEPSDNRRSILLQTRYPNRV
jgi:hypothetical protein